MIDEQFTMIQIKSSDRENKQSMININQWKFARKGTDHFIFFNKNNQSSMSKHALIFQTLKQTDIIDQCFQKLYNKQIKNSQISKFILQNQQYSINAHIDQQTVQQFLKQNKCDKANCKKLWITQNLFQTDQWDIFIEFKLKSALPTIYTLDTIQQISNQLEIPLKQIQGYLKDSQPEQKTKWYKKNFDKKIKHQNPLHIFINKKEDIPDYCHTKLFKHYNNQIQQPNYETINRKIHTYLLSTKIIDIIFQLQTQFVGSVPSSLKYPKKQLIQRFKVEDSYEKIFEGIPRKQNKYQKLGLQKLQNNLRQQPCIDNQQYVSETIEEYIDRLYRFLVSLTWKDVSIYYRATNNFMKEDMIIIDYQLKKYGKIAQNQNKQRKILKQYLLIKSKIN